MRKYIIKTYDRGDIIAWTISRCGRERYQPDGEALNARDPYNVRIVVVCRLGEQPLAKTNYRYQSGIYSVEDDLVRAKRLYTPQCKASAGPFAMDPSVFLASNRISSSWILDQAVKEYMKPSARSEIRRDLLRGRYSTKTRTVKSVCLHPATIADSRHAHIV